MHSSESLCIHPVYSLDPIKNKMEITTSSNGSSPQHVPSFPSQPFHVNTSMPVPSQLLPSYPTAPVTTQSLHALGTWHATQAMRLAAAQQHHYEATCRVAAVLKQSLPQPVARHSASYSTPSFMNPQMANAALSLQHSLSFANSNRSVSQRMHPYRQWAAAAAMAAVQNRRHSLPAVYEKPEEEMTPYQWPVPTSTSVLPLMDAMTTGTTPIGNSTPKLPPLSSIFKKQFTSTETLPSIVSLAPITTPSAENSLIERNILEKNQDVESSTEASDEQGFEALSLLQQACQTASKVPSSPELSTSRSNSTPSSGADEQNITCFISPLCQSESGTAPTRGRPRLKPLLTSPSIHATPKTPTQFPLSPSGIYHCPWKDCQFHSRKLYNLRSHYQTHIGLKPFQCEVCGVCFSRNHDLTRHRRGHEGVKPFSCRQCGKGFTRHDAMVRHSMVPGSVCFRNVKC